MCIWFNFFSPPTVFSRACTRVFLFFWSACVFLWCTPQCLLYKPKEVITHAPSQRKQRTKHISLHFPPPGVANTLLHMHRCSTFDSKSHKPNQFDVPTWEGADVSIFFHPVYLQTGTLSSDECFLHAGWSVSVNWFEMMLFQEKSMHFFNDCNYAPHVNSSRDLHEVIVGAMSTDAFLLRFN